MPTVTEILRELEAAGSEQTRGTYRRHGVDGPQFGVSYATLGALTKRIKRDHALAMELWARDLGNYVITDAFSKLAGQSAHVRAKFEKWASAKDEWIGRTAWLILGHIASDPSDIPDSFFVDQLATIEREIHGRKNRVRDAMNSALINIALRNATLRKAAVAAAKRIGTVEVDHGDTNCKTPDAIAYIEKVEAHRASKAKKPAPAAKKAKAKA
jgi:3-methyladenine DNA glycosylase AlkD